MRTYDKKIMRDLYHLEGKHFSKLLWAYIRGKRMNETSMMHFKTAFIENCKSFDLKDLTKSLILLTSDSEGTEEIFSEVEDMLLEKAKLLNIA